MVYKNDQALVKLVNKELERYASDFTANMDELMQYWNPKSGQFEFKVWSREIDRAVRESE